MANCTVFLKKYTYRVSPREPLVFVYYYPACIGWGVKMPGTVFVLRTTKELALPIACPTHRTPTDYLTRAGPIFFRGRYADREHPSHDAQRYVHKVHHLPPVRQRVRYGRDVILCPQAVLSPSLFSVDAQGHSPERNAVMLANQLEDAFHVIPGRKDQAYTP